MRHSPGSSLIESLTALAVFAIGSACTVTWMAQSMATHARATRLMAATTAAVSLEARMHANRAAIRGGHYASKVTAKASSTPSCDNGCDSAGVAADDLRAFQLALGRMGVAATGSVRCDVDMTCVIRVAWSGRDVLVWPFDA